MKVLAFSASSSRTSINKKLVTYATGLLDDCEVDIIDLNDYELPLFSVDREKELGQPVFAQAFIDKIAACDGLVISFAEHNGSYTAAYKNIFDWASRINPKVFQHKPMVMLATSPGPGGGANVLAVATASAPHFEGQLQGSLSVPRFYDNFDAESGCLRNDEINQALINVMAQLFD